MNFVIVKFVTFAFVIVVINGANVRPMQLSLNEAYKIMKESMDAEAAKGSHMVPNQTNYDCITKTLKLSENGGKVMDRSLANDYFLTAMLKCLNDEGKKEYIILMLNTLVYTHKKTDNHRCNKVMLQKMDPKSKLIENFDKDITNEEVVACDTLIPAEEYKFLKYAAFSRAGDKSCYEEPDIKKTYYLTVVMGRETNEDLIKAEYNRYVEEFGPKFTEILSCSMDNLMANLM